MRLPPRVGEELLDALRLDRAQRPRQAEAPLPLGVLLGEDMSQPLLLETHLAGPRDVVPLGSAFPGLHLRHARTTLSWPWFLWDSGAGTSCVPPSARRAR